MATCSERPTHTFEYFRRHKILLTQCWVKKKIKNRHLKDTFILNVKSLQKQKGIN